MDTLNFTPTHKKGQHLTREERYYISIRLNIDHWSIYKIAKELHRPYNTIKQEVQCGTEYLYNGKVKRYKPDIAEQKYKDKRANSKRYYRCLECVKFLNYVVEMFTQKSWSLDASVGYAKENNLFSSNEMVCTKTLYNYVDLGLLTIKNIDLSEKLKRNTKSSNARKNRKILGKSIEERPETVNSREEFGHWEIDSVLGKKKDTEPAIMTIVERQTRMSLWIKVKDHSSLAIDEALQNLINQFGNKKSKVFKSITGDNGSEFANLSKIENNGISAYFTHPYTSCEKGTNECHNKMLRRFSPKGKSINDYDIEDILFFSDVINGLPRKILNYHTPEELFEKQLDRIYAA